MPNNEALIRLVMSVGLFGLFAVAEFIFPRRALVSPKISRWFGNLTLTVFNTMLMRALFVLAGTGAVGIAFIAADNGWGMLNNLGLPAWLNFVIALLALDALVYGQHLVLHKVPLLWRLHRVHHADTDIDVSTGLRFHPLEIVLSMLVKMCGIVVIGAPALSVLVFEIILNATSMFNHANWRIPLALDRLLRLIVVTPDMHRVHHSVLSAEYNSNFGFNLPWWDYFFHTYQAQPGAGHDQMTIGLEQYRAPEWRNPLGLIMIPFRDGTISGDTGDQ